MRFLSVLLTGKASKLVSFFSMDFLLLFLPIGILGYSIFPKKAKRYFLLGYSYLFFAMISGKLVFYLVLTTFAMHYFGLWLDRIRMQKEARLKEVAKEEKKAVKEEYRKKSCRVLVAAAVIQIGGLLVVKYSGFFLTNINTVLRFFKADFRFSIPHFLMPIGISFFTLQAVSYLIDVYHQTVEADENLFRLGLFISFFPQIIEGPICRYSQTANQLWECGPITYRNLTSGIQRILYGMMKKVVVADRLNPLIQKVFEEYSSFDGGMIALASVCYTIQLYMDFSGAMDAVVGVSKIFGISMPENFERPFFSKTISEFWKRWHITLGTFFRDYIFYPVTMSKPMKKLTTNARKKLGNHFGPLLAGAIALFCVWFSNGLWHGADWNYIFYGMYHFMWILLGNAIAPAVRTVNTKLHIRSESPIYKGVQIIRTTVIVVIGELFFRAAGMKNGWNMFKILVTRFSLKSINDEMFQTLGVDYLDMAIVLVTLVIVLVVSILKEKGLLVREQISKKSVVIRWGIWYALILYIVIFGAYGFGYVPVDPMYAEF